MTEIRLDLKKREEIGKNKVDKLRESLLIPGVIYSRGEDSIHVSGSEKDLLKVYSEAGTSNIVKVNIDGEEKNVLFKAFQRHPFKNHLLHFDMMILNMKEKIKVQIPVVLEGRDEIKVQPSVLMQLLNEIEVECLPGNLPSEAKVNVTEMQIGDTITVKDLDIFSDSTVEILIDSEEPVAILQEPKEEVVEETETEESAEVPTVDETKDAE